MNSSRILLAALLCVAACDAEQQGARPAKQPRVEYFMKDGEWVGELKDYDVQRRAKQRREEQVRRDRDRAYAPLPAVVPEDDPGGIVIDAAYVEPPEDECIMRRVTIGEIMRAATQPGVGTKDIAASAYDQYVKCGFAPPAGRRK